MSPLPRLSINLLTARKHSFDKSVQAAERAKIYAGIILLAYLIIVVAVVVVDAVMAGQNKGLISEISKLKLSISSQAANEEKLLNIAAKAKAIESIIGHRKVISDIWNNSSTMLPTGAKIGNFDMSDNKVSLSIQAPHVVKAAVILDVLENNQQGFTVAKSDVGVSRSDDASYTLQVEMSLDSKKEKKSEDL